MKRIHFKKFGLSLLTTFLVGCMFGQSDELVASKSFAAGKSSSTSNLEAKKLSPAVNEKVSKSFLKSFKTAQTPVWSEGNGTYVATFYFKGRHVLAWFKKSGLLDGTIYYGSEKDLPLREKEMIQSSFPDYEITATQEIDCSAAHAWVVVVQNCKTIKKVRILDDTVEVIENIIRSE
jgi:hypothetical protein